MHFQTDSIKKIRSYIELANNYLNYFQELIEKLTYMTESLTTLSIKFKLNVKVIKIAGYAKVGVMNEAIANRLVYDFRLKHSRGCL